MGGRDGVGDSKRSDICIWGLGEVEGWDEVVMMVFEFEGLENGPNERAIFCVMNMRCTAVHMASGEGDISFMLCLDLSSGTGSADTGFAQIGIAETPLSNVMQRYRGAV